MKGKRRKIKQTWWAAFNKGYALPAFCGHTKAEVKRAFLADERQPWEFFVELGFSIRKITVTEKQENQS